jgi:hypothetical protein
MVWCDLFSIRSGMVHSTPKKFSWAVSWNLWSEHLTNKFSLQNENCIAYYTTWLFKRVAFVQSASTKDFFLFFWAKKQRWQSDDVNYCVENLRCASTRKLKCSIKSQQLISFVSSRSLSRDREAKEWEPTVIHHVFFLTLSKTFRRSLIAVGWRRGLVFVVWDASKTFGLSVGAYLFFHYAQNFPSKAHSTEEQNKRSNDGRHSSEVKTRDGHRFFLQIPSSSPLLSRLLNGEINQESQGRVWCGKLRVHEVRADS